MKQRISIKAAIVSLLILLSIFLPERIDLGLAFDFGGIQIRFIQLATLSAACLLFFRFAGNQQRPERWAQIRGLSAAIFLMISGILVSEAFAVTFLEADLAQAIQDTVPVLAPILLAWVLCLDEWRQGDVERLLRLFLWSSLLVTMIDLLLLIHFAPLYSAFGWAIQGAAWSARPRQAFGSAISIAALLSMVLPIALFFQRQGRGLSRIPYLLFPWILLVGIVLQASRLAALTVVSYLFFTTGAASRRDRTLRVVALATLLISIFMVYNYIGSFFKRYTVILGDASPVARVESGIVGLHVFGDHPLLGTGIGVFYPRSQETIGELEYVDLRGLGEKLMVYRGQATLPDPHDLYIMWLAELGLAGAAGLVALIWVLTNYSIRVINAAKRGGLDASLFRAARSGILLVGAQMFGASFLLNNGRMSILIWIYLALALEVSRRTLFAASFRELSIRPGMQRLSQGDRQY